MKNLIYRLLIATSVLSISSCGNDKTVGRSSSENNNQAERETLSPDGSNIDGLYKATFVTLNPHVNGTIPGGVTFLRKEDRLYAYVRLFAGGPRVWHQQNVYTGSRCPTMEDDLNKDGFIDIVEANLVLGNIIIPLDADIGSQTGGKRFFPLSDLSGSYSYERVTSFSRFFKDLKAPDNDPNDNMVKLEENAGFTFVGKVVMIQGTSNSIKYPDTVASPGKYKPYQTLPIACGVFYRPEETVGTPLGEGEVVLGPVAPVEEDQDRPAAPGDGEYYPPRPGSEHGSGTNTNEEGETTEGRTDPENYGNNG